MFLWVFPFFPWWPTKSFDDRQTPMFSVVSFTSLLTPFIRSNERDPDGFTNFNSYHFHCLHRIIVILITKVSSLSKKNFIESSTSLSQISSQVPLYLLCAKSFAPAALLSKESPPAPFLCLPQTNVIKTIASSSRVSSERAPSVSSVETAARRIKTTSAIPTFYNSKFEWCERPHSFMD